MSRKVLVKNRAPAPIQITAEQILREANDRVVQEDKAPRTHITDPEELREVRGREGGRVEGGRDQLYGCCACVPVVSTAVAHFSLPPSPLPAQQYRVTKRKEFEDQIRRQRQHLGTYMKYAAWEESQNEFERARSVYERCLDVDYRK
jgi:crooked neck